MLPAVPDRALAELGRTEGGPDTLALLVRDQDTRRLLLLRAVLDAAESADEAVCDAARKARLRDDWALLTEADGALPSGAHRNRGAASPDGADGTVEALRHGADTTAGTLRNSPDSPVRPGSRPAADAAAPDLAPHAAAPALRQAPPPPPDPTISPARARLLHPLTGPWALRCLRELTGAGAPDPRRLARDLAYFSALAAVAAARARIPFTTRLTAVDGVLTLPSLGALHTAESSDAEVEVSHRDGRLTLRQPAAPDVVVHLESRIGAWSGALAWTPLYALPGLLPSAPPMPLDDLDPYRTADGPRQYSLSGPTTLDDAERKRWLQAWSGTAAALRPGGAHRVAEATLLLRCLVPLEMPPGGGPDGRGRGSCSATRREAFGALLSSTPPDAVTFAATLVHELHHTKLAALSDMVTLHRSPPGARYFAPWRPDPRPYDGLLQGAYSHLALADFFQRRALTAAPAHRETAWAQHARYRAQVGAALPALVGSPDLTARGRRFVDEMVATYERMADAPAPRGHTARAQAYVKAARALWTQRHAPGIRHTREPE